MARSVEMPPAAAEDINGLLQAAFDTAMQILAEEGKSRPFGVLLDLDARTLIRHMSRPPGTNDDDLMRQIAQATYEEADTLQPALLVQHTGDDVFPTIRGYGDHRDATGFAFFINWRPGRGGGPASVAHVIIERSRASVFR